MEFHEKLQELRKQKGLTQEELAATLYVSRAAISKWESGRGYPSIDSLRAIAVFFGVTVDELLSTDAVLRIAEEDHRQKEGRLRDLVFGLLDLSVASFLFLPLFGQRVGDGVSAVSLLSLSVSAPWMRGFYLAAVIAVVAWGLLTLTFQNCRFPLWLRCKNLVSLLLNTLGALLFIVSSQPYAAAFLFMLWIIKALTLIKQP
ncbi:MAG: helix-turn-helix transcriptional regulator [Clostridia bacterium]|nr:helix-turn-helix transcriptional regulator [Clostridia bacterium]